MVSEITVSAVSLPQQPLGVEVYDRDADASNASSSGGLRKLMNDVADKVRRVTPTDIVNHGGQINFGMRAVADGFSVWSAIREGSKSPPRLIASLITLGSEVMGVFFKDNPITAEERDAYRKQSWSEYFFTKTKQSMDPVHHIGEASGMALMLNGLLTAISGIRQSTPAMRSWEIWQGVFTSVAGMFMTYMPVRERAWQLSSLTFVARTPFAWLQARRAYGYGYPDVGVKAGDWQQGAKFVMNQLSTAFGFFYGGVRKLPDGTIVRIEKKAEPVDATLSPRVSEKLATVPSSKVDAQSADRAAQPVIVEGLTI